jgi:hypothetical protein
MHSQHPEMAARWEKDTPKHAKLPERVGKMTAVEGDEELLGHAIPLIGKCEGIPLIGKLEPGPARGGGPAYPYGRQTLPDYQYIYNVTPSKKDQKQTRKELDARRRASAARNNGKYGFHGAPPTPVLRNERGAFNAVEPGKSGDFRTKPTVLPALIFKPTVDQARSRLVQRKRVP